MSKEAPPPIIPDKYILAHERYWKRPDADIGAQILSETLCPELVSNDRLLLIRDEYIEFYKYVSSTFRQKELQGVILYGHPGTGKSLFIRSYGLARTLQDGFKTCLCTTSAHFYLCDDDGVHIMDYVYNKFGGDRVLVFADVVPFPQDPFTSIDRVPALIVHATSPKLERWRGWAKQLADVVIWIIKPWSMEEIRLIKQYSADKYFTPLEVAETSGPSARECSRVWPRKSPDAVFELGETELVLPSSEKLLQALSSGNIEDGAQRTGFHDIFFFEPIPGKDRPIPWNYSLNHYIRHYIPTDALRNRVWRNYDSLAMIEQQNLCHKLTPFPQVCGVAFEVLGVKWLTTGSLSLPCIFTPPQQFSLPAGLRTLDSRDSDVLLNAETDTDVLWLPGPGFPTVDAVAVTTHNSHRCVTLLQMTIARTHDISPKDIAKIWQTFGDIHDVTWRFLFVVPTTDIGESVARRTHITQRQPAALSKEPPAKRQRRANLKLEISVGYLVAPFMTEKQRAAIKGDFTDNIEDEGRNVVVDLEEPEAQ